MTEPTMNENQVLSVLNAMDSEVNVLLAQKKAYANVRQVILKYIEAQKSLAGLDQTKKNLEDSIAGLRPRMDSELRVFNQEVAAKKAAITTEIEMMSRKAREIREALITTDTELKEKVNTGNLRLGVLEKEIAEKSKQLEKLKAGISELKTAHRLS